MLAQEAISQEEFDAAYNVPLYLSQNRKNDTSSSESNIHSYYIDAVIDDVIAEFIERYGIDKTTASRKVYSGGLTIITNLEPRHSVGYGRGILR